MPDKTIYLNLDDDVAKITAKLKRLPSSDVVLVAPKGSLLFSDSINLRLLKKQVDMLGKKVSILTMDEAGQGYAKSAGFTLKTMPKTVRSTNVSDIAPRVVRSMVKTPTVRNQSGKPIAKPKKITSVSKSNIQKKRIVKSVPPTTRIRSKNIVPVNTNIAVPAESVPSRLLPKLDKPKKSRLRNMPTRAIVVFLSLTLILAVLLYVFILPQGTIVVSAKNQAISRNIDLTVSTAVGEPSSTQLLLPGEVVDRLAEVESSYEATGQKEVGSQAQGKIVILNLTGRPLNLRANTTVLTVGNRNYTFDEDQANITPIATVQDDKDATVANITAQAGGEDYNLPAGTRLEITNQAFGSQPTRLFAKTVTQVVGGSSRYVSVITEEDVANAQKALNQKAADELRNQLSQRSLTLPSDAFIATPSEFIVDKSAGTEAPSFIAKTKVQISGMAFDQDSLLQLLRERMELSIDKGKLLQSANLDSVTIKVKNIDIAGGKLALSVFYESKIIPQFETAELKNQLAGKNKEQASEILLSNPDVEKIEIKLSPSWQRSLPRWGSKIKLEVNPS